MITRYEKEEQNMGEGALDGNMTEEGGRSKQHQMVGRVIDIFCTFSSRV